MMQAAVTYTASSPSLWWGGDRNGGHRCACASAFRHSRESALLSKEIFGECREPAWYWAFAANSALEDLFSKATPNSSFPRRREPKCDSPQALKEKAKHLARKVFFLSCRALGDSHLDTRLRGYDEDWNGSWTVVRESGNPEHIPADSCARGYVLWIPACAGMTMRMVFRHNHSIASGGAGGEEAAP